MIKASTRRLKILHLTIIKLDIPELLKASLHLTIHLTSLNQEQRMISASLDKST